LPAAKRPRFGLLSIFTVAHDCGAVACAAGDRRFMICSRIGVDGACRSLVVFGLGYRFTDQDTLGHGEITKPPPFVKTSLDCGWWACPRPPTCQGTGAWRLDPMKAPHAPSIRVVIEPPSIHQSPSGCRCTTRVRRCKWSVFSWWQQTTEFADAARRVRHLALAAFSCWGGCCRLCILGGGESVEPLVQKSRNDQPYDQPYKLTARPSSQRPQDRGPTPELA